MKLRVLVLSSILALVVSILVPAVAVAGSVDKTTRVEGADLGIGHGIGHRPNILVAWRNTERILEVEILVRNMGDEPGRGDLYLDICDEEGKTLLSTDATPVTVPARDKGGEEGVIVQSKGFRLMNLMFDQLDRLDQRYKLRARIESDDDINPLDNIAAKSFNADSAALPGAMSFYRYRFTNSEDHPIEATLGIDHDPAPEGWKITANPAPGTPITLQPGEVFTGNILVDVPDEVSNGDFIDFLVSLNSTQDGMPTVLDKDEWFLVATDEPPQVGEPTITVRPDGTVAVNAVAYDPICGIKEASGVQVFYSLDGGVTFSTRVMAYTRGNFYDRTWFEGILGPFPEGTEIASVVTVTNNAGLHRRFELDPVTVEAPPAVTPSTALGGAR